MGLKTSMHNVRSPSCLTAHISFLHTSADGQEYKEASNIIKICRFSPTFFKAQTRRAQRCFRKPISIGQTLRRGRSQQVRFQLSNSERAKLASSLWYLGMLSSWTGASCIASCRPGGTFKETKKEERQLRYRPSKKGRCCPCKS